MRRSILLSALLLVAISAPTAPSANAATPVTFTRHLTRVADGTNAPCGPLKMFIVRAHLQRGHRFHDLHAFRIRLRGGKTLRVRFEPWDLSRRGRVATWYARDVGDAKVSRRLALSRTTFTATPGSRWHATISASCYTL